MKVLLQNVAQDHDYTDRFHRRARAIARLSHSNIIPIYDEGIEGDVHYMAMEYLKGTDLQKRSRNMVTLSPDELVNIMIPVINALGTFAPQWDCARKYKVLQASSCTRMEELYYSVLEPSSRPKGTDLSFSRDMESVEYLSPEEASGKGMDGRSDIYSLGVVMYYSLTGKFPYSRSDIHLASINIDNQWPYTPINRLRQVPQWLENIVDRCLQKDISKRVQSCGEILALLNARVNGSINRQQPGRATCKRSSFGRTAKRKIVDTEPTEVKTTTPPVVEQPTRKRPSLSTKSRASCR